MPPIEIDIIGRSCRLPGAANVDAFWNLLNAGRCSVGTVSPERFSMFRYRNPGPGQRGKAYSFAAGVLDDIWGFDPGVFGISPREATHMDPQQRLLLTLVWEAFEDAGIPASKIADRDVGVYVGNSGVDHNNRYMFDPAGTDPYMMTGNAGALISNRISYVFDLHGPSMTIDTACSSSLVALNEAIGALRSGKIDTAIVAGVHLLLSAFPFVGFSAATMLSPDGLCRPFAEAANGYVRAEGGVVLVLERASEGSGHGAGIGHARKSRSHGRIVESGVNSDGRTVGAALPSAEYQAKLIQEIYQRAGIDANELAFVEAHGTGTRVGDPAEAEALGRVLGQSRTRALSIGSVKSNIGHLEPASGIAGLLKVMLALEHDRLPASLHFDNPNPDIAWDDLNLKVANVPLDIERGDGRRFAGISNFGFGGANVHVILTDPVEPHTAANPMKSPPLTVHETEKVTEKETEQTAHNMLLISAQSEGALRNLAGQYSELISGQSPQDLSGLVNAAAYTRQRMQQRIVTHGGNAEDISIALKAFSNNETAPNLVSGNAIAPQMEVALVFAGNGSQWAGMGRPAFNNNQKFKAVFQNIDRLFSDITGWSLEDKLFADDLKEQLQSTLVAQPLLFALQVATVDTLKEMGLSVGAVIGHSVGEVAAAYASGALNLDQSIRIIHARSKYLEIVRGSGGMAALMLSEAEASAALDGGEFSRLNISAINSDRSVTISGPRDDLEGFSKLAASRQWACQILDIDYPFHSALIDPSRGLIVDDLSSLEPGPSDIPFYSTVEGGLLSGDTLNADYWWRNVREPVRFMQAVKNAAADGCRLFMEISPRSILRNYLIDSTAEFDQTFTIIKSFSRADEAGIDPVKNIFARAIAAGAEFDDCTVFGAPRETVQKLPLYPWQNTQHRLNASSEALEVFDLSVPPHPLLGQQLRAGEYVWSNDVDPKSHPYLKDHKVSGKMIMPGAAFAEIALAAARQWLKCDRIELRDMDLFQALELMDDAAVQINTRLDIETGTVEISSRNRLSSDEWRIHAKCRVAEIPGDKWPDRVAPELRASEEFIKFPRIYELSLQFGLDYGPSFRRMIRCDEVEDGVIEVVLNERDPAHDPDDGETESYLFHPIDLDGCFHGLNLLYEEMKTRADKLAYIPIRLGVLRLYAPTVSVRTARIRILRWTSRSIQADCECFDASGRLVATLTDARFRASALAQRHKLDRVSYSVDYETMPRPANAQSSAAPPLAELLSAARGLVANDNEDKELDERRLLLDAAARRTAYDILKTLGDAGGCVDIDASVEQIEPDLNRLSAEDRIEQQRTTRDQRVALLSALAAIAEQSGMATISDNGCQLKKESTIPPADDILRNLLNEDPRLMSEVVLLNRARYLIPELLGTAKSTSNFKEKSREETEEENQKNSNTGRDGRSGKCRPQDFYSASMLEQMASTSPFAHVHVTALAKLIESVIANWPKGRPLRILELGVGVGALAKRLYPLIASRHGQLVSVDSDKSNINRLKVHFAEQLHFEGVVLTDDGDALFGHGPFDMLVSANGLHMLSQSDAAIEAAISRLAPDGIALVTTTEPDAFHDIVYGPVPGWFDNAVDPHFPLGPMRKPSDWQPSFEDGGHRAVETIELSQAMDNVHLILTGPRRGNIFEDDGITRLNAVNGNGSTNGEPHAIDLPSSNGHAISNGPVEKNAQILTTTNGHSPSPAPSSFGTQMNGALKRRVIIVTSDNPAERDFRDTFSKSFAEADIDADHFTCQKNIGQEEQIYAEMRETITQADDAHIIDVVHLAGAFTQSEDAFEATAYRTKNLTQLLQSIGTENIRLWIISPGGARAISGSGASDPVQCGIWAFGRTAINEYGDRDIRLVDFAEQLSPSEFGDALSEFLSTPGSETEIILGRDGISALRMRRGIPKAAGAATVPDAKMATIITHSSSGAMNSLRWGRMDLNPPEAHEVQIRVAAAGLNFRDVMWLQGALPEEALEDGFAGPSLGFECSGHISAIGKDVKKFKLGDRVMALAPACFASHVTVSGAAIASVPNDVDLEGAAAIPVAFLTSYYALHHLARLEKDERVLIHGAAGGVGLAALQIAKWRGAKIIATAGNDEKRQFLKLLGADHVLDTRSLDFADQIREITKDETGIGVDVVLNSLSGEAMERSIELLRPFGRFLELGKRDFYGNTKIGLRPFRQNLTYHGIDADQLFNHQPKLCQRMFRELTELFERKDLTQLAYRMFGGADIIDAFRLMQQSGHIGKILIKPPQELVTGPLITDDAYKADRDGVHVIIGGLGGFGIEAASWLADHGAKSIVLTSRSARIDEAGEKTISALGMLGLDVEIIRCDVSSRQAVADLLKTCRKKGSVKGIMHAAMVLDDALIQNLTGEQIEQVLRPKIAGADNLDQLSRHDDLDYFVLFSSAAALFGNPGQAHYVTANAYLDGLARQRRSNGLKALAVGWGAITDVGILARQTDTAKTLAHHTGGINFTARQGLDLMGQLLVAGCGESEEAVVTLAPMNWAYAADSLPIIDKPAFKLLAREAQSGASPGLEQFDIRSLITGLDDAKAGDKIANLLAEEVAVIFRMPVEEINLKRSLADIGMDSLMGMELRSAAHQKLGIDIPMVSIADGTTIMGIAHKVLEQSRSKSEAPDQAASTDLTLRQQHMPSDLDKDKLDDLTYNVRKREMQVDRLV